MRTPPKTFLLITLFGFAGCSAPPQEISAPLSPASPVRAMSSRNPSGAKEGAEARQARVKELRAQATAQQAASDDDLSLVGKASGPELKTVPSTAAMNSNSVTPTKEVDAAARKMLAQAEKAKTLTDLAPCLTNASAARIGKKSLFMMSMTALAVAQSESQANYYYRAAKKDFEPILAKYKFNVSDPPQKQALVEKYLDAHGRELLLDVDPVVRKGLERERPGDPRNGLDGKQTFSLPPDKYTIYQVSPTVLYITTNGKAGLNGQHFEARWEDGAWRLHMTATRRRLVNGQLTIVPGTSGLDNAFSTLPRIMPAPGRGFSSPPLSQGHPTD